MNMDRLDDYIASGGTGGPHHKSRSTANLTAMDASPDGAPLPGRVSGSTDASVALAAATSPSKQQPGRARSELSESDTQSEAAIARELATSHSTATPWWWALFILLRVSAQG